MGGASWTNVILLADGRPYVFCKGREESSHSFRKTMLYLICSVFKRLLFLTLKNKIPPVAHSSSTKGHTHGAEFANRRWPDWRLGGWTVCSAPWNVFGFINSRVFAQTTF